MGGQLIRTRGATQTQLNTPGEELRQGTKLFGDNQWRVVGQHDAAGTDTNGFGGSSDLTDEHGCGRTGDTGHVVMLGHPVTVEAKLLGMSCQIQHIMQGLRDCAVAGNRRQV